MEEETRMDALTLMKSNISTTGKYVKYVSNEGKYDNMTEDELLSEAESWTEEEQINYLLQGGYTDKSGFINLTDIIIDEIFPEETKILSK